MPRRARSASACTRGARLAPAAAVALLATACTPIIFQPETGHRTDPGRFDIAYRDVRFEASDGTRLHGWFMPALDEARATVVFAHGNAENISTHAAAVIWLREHGYNVFSFDYRGYGVSGGTPTMVGVHRDTVAALDAAHRADELPRGRLVLVGQSLGGAIATVVAARVPAARAPGALVVDSAPSDYRDVARERLADWWLTWPLQVPLSWLITSDYAAADAAPDLPSIPKLFIGNTGDPTIPAHHARRLFDAATAPADCWIVELPGHRTTFADPSLRARFLAWLDRALGAPGAGGDTGACRPPGGQETGSTDPSGAG